MLFILWLLKTGASTLSIFLNFLGENLSFLTDPYKAKHLHICTFSGLKSQYISEPEMGGHAFGIQHEVIGCEQGFH